MAVLIHVMRGPACVAPRGLEQALRPAAAHRLQVEHAPHLVEPGVRGDNSVRQGPTLVHFSAQRKRFERDRGCIEGLFGGCQGVLGGVQGESRVRNGSR
jgi:hypothetical protein